MTIERSIPVGNQDQGERRRRPYIPPRAERGRFEKAVQDFDIPKEALMDLSEEERRVFAKLTTFVRRTEELFALQEGPDDRSKFYPQGVKDYEIRREAESNPELLSPYTLVTLGPDGELTALPMMEAYRGEIENKQLKRILKEASALAGRGKKKDEGFRAYLKAKAKWLETGKIDDFKAADKIWLERENEPTIGFVFGLYDSYQDRFLHIKNSWWASVDVLDRPLTDSCQRFLDQYQVALAEKHQLELPHQKVRVGHTRIYAGLAQRMGWSANSLFPESDLRQVGSLHLIFEPKYLGKFYGERLPAFREFIDPSKIQGITDSFALIGDLRLYIAHESGHSIIPADLEARLQKEKDWMEELYCELLALTTYRDIQGVSKRESEVAMAMSLIDGYMEYVKRPRSEDYFNAYAAIAGYLSSNEVLRIEEGKFTWNDTQEVFETLNTMYTEVEKIFFNGKARDAQIFLQNYFNPTIYRYMITQESTSRDLKSS